MVELEFEYKPASESHAFVCCYKLNKRTLSKGPKGLWESAFLTAKWGSLCYRGFCICHFYEAQMRPCMCHKNGFKAITEHSSGSSSGPGDEFSLQKTDSALMGFSVLWRTYSYFPLLPDLLLEKIICDAAFSFALWPCLSWIRDAWWGEPCMRQAIWVRRGGHAPYPSETKDLVLEETLPKA